jgi:hypothetical protein
VDPPAQAFPEGTRAQEGEPRRRVIRLRLSENPLLAAGFFMPAPTAAA